MSSKSGQNGQPPQSPPAIRTFNPAALLNPRGAMKKSSSKKESTPPMKAATTQAGRQTGSIHISPTLNRENSSNPSMLEKLYSVERRSDQPHKKQKTSATTDEPEKSTQNRNSYNHHSTGIVGEYLKPDADKTTSAADLNKLVDLTGTDDEGDELQIVSSRNILEDKEVCFGQVAAIVHAHQVPKPRSSTVNLISDGQWPPMRCTLRRAKAKHTVIEVLDPFDVPFGKIDIELATVLAPAMDELPKFRTQPRLLNRKKSPNDWPHKACSEQMNMLINIYGRRGDALRVGQVFGQRNIWFKSPTMPDKNIPIENPHAHKLATAKPKVGTRGSVLSETRTIEETTEAVSKLFDHFADSTIPLPETETPDIIRTPLLKHQKQGLTFLLQHERPRTYGAGEADNSSLWRIQQNGKGHKVYLEVVSGIMVADEPTQVYGGLLADVMGLGKSLEALSLIASTRDEAEVHGQEKIIRKTEEDAHLITAAKATLVVCPTSTVKNWEDQISEHVRPGELTYHVYHGPNRCKNPFELAKFDIVITTYGILSSEFSGRGASGRISLLGQVRWFRVVLDEAHTIRESKSIQSQAAFFLAAQRRWCLTGTPIQNRIDDLGSLTRFLRMYPYDTAHRFGQYIRSPAQAGDPIFLKSLRVFVDSFTLRRLKDRIDLPRRNDLVETLEFSPGEKRLHDFFKEIANNRIQELTRDKRTTSGVQHHVLRGILTLRLICAHGRDLLKEKDLEKLKGIDPGDAIDLDDDLPTRQINKKEAYDCYLLMAEAELDLCRNCDKRISGDSPRAEADEENEGARACVLPCYDLVCVDCFEPYKTQFETADPDVSVVCPFCALDIAPQYIPITNPDNLDAIAPEELDIEKGKPVKPKYSGPHTKTLALIRDIDEMKKMSQPLEEKGEPPLKCVVFSEFTSHLDLIERALNDRGYTHVRIDGTMSLNQRKKVLDALAIDDSVTILLASIKAAGQGLNLTAASRAFIMEPMWNPAAEAQAVDRIHRIGQKREVTIKRFQMNDSIEGKIIELQKRKQALADVSMNRNHGQLSKKEVREKHMKDILALFK